MKREDFIEVEGFETAIEHMIKTGKCPDGGDCYKCPFSSRNSVINAYCSTYTEGSIGSDEFDATLKTSAEEFKEKFCYTKPENDTTTRIVVQQPYIYALKNGKVGLAKCHKDDTFNPIFGKGLAIARLEGDKEKEDELLGVVDWSKVRRNAKVRVNGLNRHFYTYRGEVVYCYPKGKSEWTHNNEGLIAYSLDSNIIQLIEED